MTRKQYLLLIKRLPPNLRIRLEGTDPNVIDAMEVQRALLERQTELVRNGATEIPSLGELFDQYFGDTIKSSTQPS
ncbi:hypothetical protein A3C09_04470 [Candidatus Uhrbacteria bacterium RIFCSPHIGHO2_02_FULL_47_44]|uniref:Uncharacterized protein n=1 Tax=Candidatus Uhrbacteria bacterium RIFCSPLOWO2_02_FULL_48_18 TaxID=1802408 RepID=A0A1F7VDV5_9BACT|nr:MAG: hypothetical protein A2839_03785 [Candidatus Uhrbacteria bacterium RIFCSPHIGHO2_01_FULL_47_10]OGL70159.1 MAG: hypothetical protein A3C09_04470 [Candidatus Uhrbacteria bacterium RIFCSPHIGHO2_02_FULL_47_44]OGL77831.1 MAG: hypothetical protein A3E97_02630 [Candidatus Uhrbacteria bacterium RIFCSPHIGHO2_12_FULL_47_12]OGL80650.1 MAG: hypothetical protein A3B20_04625 [Candidatus Uhrbacteria bacterium RIFCSPLOWO2_01_FULL_47_17]OGL88167.1 MAG: hypothetical protein A3I41_00355 [Candidatus Uhrbact